MADYTYECPECESQEDISHSMLDNPDILCKKCKVEMFRRAPQRVVAGVSAWDQLYDKMDTRWRDYKHRKNKKNRRKTNVRR